MRIENLGDDCGKCRKLYDNVRQAVAETGAEVEVVRTNDPDTLARYGILALPGAQPAYREIFHDCAASKEK